MAFAVALYHFGYWFPILRQGEFAADTAKKIGVYGVEGFFVVSGFCFFHLYGAGLLTGRGARVFFTKRFFRIAPLFYLAIALNAAFGFTGGGVPYSGRMLLENATLTFGLFHPNHALVLGGWSVGLEFVFYFALPFLAWAAVRWRPFLTLATLVLLALSLPWTYRWVPQAPMAGDMKFHTYVAVANHGFLFLAGGLIAQARARWPIRLPRWAFLLLAGGLAAVFLLKHRHFYDDFTIMVGTTRYLFCLLSVAAVAVAAFYEAPDSPVKTVGRYLGDISYSVYILHPLVREGMERLHPGGWAPWPGFLLAVALTLGLSTLTYRFLERPLMALGKRWSAA
ncbi:acyltransferase [Mesoterricola sediminis]|uniref:Acyltransferase n=2 Tax=Mesoterricola sediminis TaxID=2927980 RepID=A0AA48KEZ6_9BACT|nr:acyltransferase [Mesoterricola sediminis]